jgi:cysteine desulfurase/selenocysteine lyase
MSFDPLAVRGEFPLLVAHGGALHYLDNAATSQIHRSALDAVIRHETTARANILRGNHRLAEAATTAYAHARRQVADYLNARSADEVVFTSGTTAAINLVAGAFGETLQRGDEVLLSIAEHHSNLLPWQHLRDRRGIVLRHLPVTAEGRIDVATLDRFVSKRCRLISLAHVGNVTGAQLDVAAVVAAARGVGARVMLDGAQAVAHGPVDVQAHDIDFYAFSGHKCFAPTGIGVLWARSEILRAMPPHLRGGGMVTQVGVAEADFAEPPQRFEAGTPPVAQAIGLGAVLEWLGGLDWLDIAIRERQLTKRLLAGLHSIRDLRVIGPIDTEARFPVVSFTMSNLHPHDICQVVDGSGVAIRGGRLCAQPLINALGVDGVSRASLAIYNGADDVDALLAALERAISVLK